MKNKILALLATIGLASSVTAVEINENLSINGFIDGSYKMVDSDSGTDTQSLDLDEVEINFLLNVGNVSGFIAIDTDGSSNVSSNVNVNTISAGTVTSGAEIGATTASTGTGTGTGTGNAGDELFNIEQAHFTYSLDNGVSFTFGHYGSALGFEREDPAGLYTFSRAYNSSLFNSGNIDAAGNDVTGLTVAYAADTFSLAASFEEAVGADLEAEDLNLEISFAYTGIENVNIGGGYFWDNAQDAAAEIDELNLHVSTTMGKIFLAAEYTQLMNDSSDRDAFMILADYDFTDKLGAALRVSQNEQGAGVGDYEKVTIAPNYSLTDSLGVILEYSDVTNDNADSDEFAVELTYTF